MKLRGFFGSILITLVVLQSVGLLLTPRTVEASVPTHEWTLSGAIPGLTPEAGIAAKELSAYSNPLGMLSTSWDSIAWYFVKEMLHEFTQSIVNWIQTGQDPFFRGGTSGSLFVTNIDKFLLDGADNAASVFLEEYYGEETWSQLCTPFRDLVGLGLSRSYGRDYGSFKFQAECTIQDIVANVEDFYNDFENGGWEAWLASASYANNPWGLLALGEETSRSRQSRASSANLNDFIAGLGFPGLRECPPENQLPGATPDGKPLCKNNGYITKTPGKAIEDQVANVYGNEFRSLEAADEIDEILFAGFRSLLSWALSSGGDGGLLGENTDIKPPPTNDDCSQSTNRPNACQCTIDTQCASNFCSPITNTCATSQGPPPPPPPPGPPPPPTP